MGGLELARKIKEKNIKVALVFLTMHNDETMFNSAMDVGVAGYVLKESAATDITECIKTVAAGRHYITPALSDFLFQRSRKNIRFQEQTDGLNSLTKTERRILKLIAEDKTSREIGELLFIHSRTVDNHRTNICQKLDIHGNHALLRFALKHQSELTD
jgi:DNA-binding NarL/FixJ family response regulator